MRLKYNPAKVFTRITELREAGHTWEEVTSVLNSELDLDLASSSYRKPYTAYKQGQEDGITDEDLAKQNQHIRKQRKMLGIERSINNEQIRDLVLRDMIDDEMKRALLKISENVLLPFEGYIKGYRASEAIPLDPSDDFYVVNLADLHYEGDNLPRLVALFGKIFDEVEERVVQNNITHIYVTELGDILEGAGLRTSQLMAIKAGMTDQLLDVVGVYITFLTRLCQLVDQVSFYCVTSSNHTQLRPLGTKQNELVDEDFMRIFAKMIDLGMGYCENFNIIAEKEIITNIQGFNFCFAHGHLIKSKEGHLEKLSASSGIEINYGIFGHFHHYREITLHRANGHNKKAFYVPALEYKYNNYAEDRLLTSNAGFTFMKFNLTRGHVYTEEIFTGGVEY